MGGWRGSDAWRLGTHPSGPARQCAPPGRSKGTDLPAIHPPQKIDPLHSGAGDMAGKPVPSGLPGTPPGGRTAPTTLTAVLVLGRLGRTNRPNRPNRPDRRILFPGGSHKWSPERPVPDDRLWGHGP